MRVTTGWAYRFQPQSGLSCSMFGVVGWWWWIVSVFRIKDLTSPKCQSTKAFVPQAWIYASCPYVSLSCDRDVDAARHENKYLVSRYIFKMQ